MSKIPIWNTELTSEEQYNEVIKEFVFVTQTIYLFWVRCNNKVLVMEVYSEWAGFCKAIQTILRRIQLENGDDKIKFTHVWIFTRKIFRKNYKIFLKIKAELVPSLSDRAGKSRPCFDIYKVLIFLYFRKK